LTRWSIAVSLLSPPFSFTKSFKGENSISDCDDYGPISYLGSLFWTSKKKMSLQYD
jgi:hypothetical protein